MEYNMMAHRRSILLSALGLLNSCTTTNTWGTDGEANEGGSEEAVATGVARASGGAAREVDLDREPALVQQWVPTKPVSMQSQARAKLRSAERREPSLPAQVRSTRIAGLQLKDEESLRVAVDALRTQTGLPFVVDSRAENAALDQGVVFNINFTNSVRVLDVLNLLMDPMDGEVGWKIAHDTILITTKECVQDKPTLRLYDVRMLTMPRTDFKAPRIDRIRLLDELEDDDGGGALGGVGEKITAIHAEDLVSMVQGNIEVASWDSGKMTIEAANGFLFVMQTADAHRRIAHFLDQLGGF
ncbi:MAG: hypothetical protein ACI835_001011 [Planctomycetota bacterium]